jgi:hypothetical protein
VSPTIGSSPSGIERILLIGDLPLDLDLDT